MLIPTRRRGCSTARSTAPATGLTEARRAIQALRASPLEELGLGGAVEQLATKATEMGSVDVSLDLIEDGTETDPAIEQAIYRIADEALTNVARHAEAAKATVRLERRGRTLVLTVWDDGGGFDAASVSSEGHHGLQGMRERAALVGGTLGVTSRPGAGTTVRFEVEAS